MVPVRSSEAMPLHGVRVLDLTRLIPGALAAKKLADLGAEVVKIEQPGRGDYQRNIPPYADGEGMLHRVLNRAKKSVTLDYRTPEGQDLLRRLAGKADAIVEVSRPGRLADFGVSLEDLRKQYPKLVICSVTGFGQTGPLSMLPSHGMVMDALSGWVTTQDDDGRERLSEANFTSVVIEYAGINAALGVVAAVMQARATGQGAWIDASCWDHGVDALRYRLCSMQSVGEDWVNPRRLGPMYDTYRCADGKPFLFACSEEKFFHQFCDRVGHPELKARWDGGGSEGDLEDDPELQAALDGIFIHAPAAEWGRRFLDWELPGTEIIDALDVPKLPHFAARDMLDEERPGDSVIPLLDALRWMEDGWRPGAGLPASAALGEHTDEVLRDWLGE